MTIKLERVLTFQEWESFDNDGDRWAFDLEELEAMAESEGSQTDLNPKSVQAIVKSLTNTNKLLQPIRVALWHDGQELRTRLVGGRHRVAALRQYSTLWNLQLPKIPALVTWVESIEQANELVVSDNGSRKMAQFEIKQLSLGYPVEDIADPSFISEIQGAKTRARAMLLFAYHLQHSYTASTDQPVLAPVTANKVAAAVAKGLLYDLLPTKKADLTEFLQVNEDLLTNIITQFTLYIDDIAESIDESNRARAYTKIASAFIRHFGEALASDVEELDDNEEYLTTAPTLG